MALIGKIREKSWLLVAVIGIAMLAFILGDLESVFGGGATEDQYGIGKVEGEKIDEDKYNNVVQNTRNQIFQNKMQQNKGQAVPLDENDEENARNQAWSAIVSEALINRELDAIGLIVDDVELDNVLYGSDNFDPSPAIAQAQIFIDSTTQEFDPNLVRQYLDNLENSPERDALERLNGTLDYVKQYRKEQKYNILLGKGLHATSLEGKEEYYAQKEVKNVSYVYQNFSKVLPDETGDILEDDLKAYYDNNKDKKKYKLSASRKLSYFSIPAVPSAEDSLRTKEQLTKIKKKFKKEDNDSLFVMNFSETKNFSTDKSAASHPQGTMGQQNFYPKEMASEVENGKVGDVIGPYINENFMAVSKIVKFVNVPSASVRHILLNAKTDEEITKAQKKADSIIRVIRSKNNFAEMVAKFSEDPGSKNKGGKYENFPEGQMVPEFNDFSFEKPIGSLGSVKTDFGIHIIEVLDRKTPTRPILATINKSIDITKSSMDNINSMASNLIYELDGKMSGKSRQEQIAIFDSIGRAAAGNVRTLNIKDDSPVAKGFGQSAEGRILGLAFDDNVKAGLLSPAPIKDKDRVVIAMVTDVQKEGVPTYEGIKSRLRSDVRKEKQAKVLLEKMNGEDDLQVLATQIGARFETEGLTFSSNNAAVGREPILIGVAFSGLIDGQRSVPVKGNNGVFVLRVDNTVEAPETTDFSTEQTQLKSQYRSTLTQRYKNALQESADVVDNRKLRSFGIR